MAAACLSVVGVVGICQAPMASQSTVGVFASKPDLAAADADLEKREIMLQQRRDAAVLLEQFIRGQMTRHYWGHFAGSLTDLGLRSGKDWKATVTSTSEASGLLLMPKRGDEAYGAGVRQRGSRVVRWQCRGPLPTKSDQLSLMAGCPKGWQLIDAKQF